MAQRHVLIGIGPASVAAAEAIREADERAEIVIVGADPHGYYSRPGLAYYLDNEIPEKALAPFTEDDFASLDLRIVSGRVTAIDRNRQTVALEAGGEIAYDRLLIATGSRSIMPRVPGAELRGIVKLDDLEDARALIRRGQRGHTAVVVGGGITALEIVEGLRARHTSVHYLMRRERYWANVLSEAESSAVEQNLTREGVTIHRHTELARILGRDGHVSGIETTDGARIACDTLAAAIGVRPEIDLATDADLDCGRGILVDDRLQSSDEHIFAAGDVAEVGNPETGRGTLNVLWNTAVHKGHVAGRNMAGKAVQVYEQTPPLNITRLAGLRTTVIGTVGRGEDADLQGLSRGDSQTWSELADAAVVEAQCDDAHVRLALGERVIAGAVVMGDQELSFPLQDLIERRVDVSRIRGQLLAGGPGLADVIRSAWLGSTSCDG